MKKFLLSLFSVFIISSPVLAQELDGDFSWDAVLVERPQEEIGIEGQRKFYVVDYADILSPETEEQIEAIVEDIVTTNTAGLTVVTVPDLGGGEINERCVELGRAWGVGTAERDDGIVFLTSVGDRKTFIAPGYGVEAYLTDAQAHWIMEDTILPYFRQGDYDSGILAGVQEIRKAIVDLEALPDISNVSSSESDNFTSFAVLITILAFSLPWLAAVFGRSKRIWPGGVVGGLTGLGLSLLFDFTLWVILPFVIFGFIFDALVSANYKKGKSKWWSGGGKGGWGGGSSGWGSGSSGSSSSGGFGGFGGGSFGGGGAGGSW